MKTLSQLITLTSLGIFSGYESLYGNIPTTNQMICFIFSACAFALALMIGGNELYRKLKNK
jgi:hypothetical protein